MRLACIAFLAAAAYAQDLEPAEVLQNVMAEHAMTPALYWKAPMSLDLDLHEPAEVPLTLRVVDSDAPTSEYVPVHTAAWQAPPPLAGACSGVCVTFSNQGAAALKAITGKRIHGFELVNAMACNLSQTDRKFGGGLIIQQANAMNIQTLSKQAGAAVVQQTLDTNWRKLVMLGLEVGTAVIMGATTSGVIAANRSWTTGLVFGHLAMDSLPSLLKPGAPNPDPFLNNVLDDNGNVNLVAGGCTAFLFSGVWSRDSVKVTGRVQLLP